MRTLLLTLFCCVLTIGSVLAREPMIDPDDMVAVELATVAVDPFTGMPLVLLREANSGSVVPISIGPEEALAIIRAVEFFQTPRPMTHDTTVALIESMGGRLERIMVDGLVDNSYYGVLDVRMDNDPDTPVYVDTRPSDALALAVRTGAGIIVAPDVLQATRGQEFEGLGDDQVVTALGITVSMVTEESREAMELPDEPGVLVLRAVGEAEEKGIGSGALILEVNGEVPTSALDFLELVQRTPVDEDATIRFWYEDEVQEVELDTHVPRQGMPPEEAGPQV